MKQYRTNWENFMKCAYRAFEKVRKGRMTAPIDGFVKAIASELAQPESRFNISGSPCRDQSRRQSAHCAERTANNRRGSNSKRSPWMPILTEKRGGEIRPKFAKNLRQFGSARQKGKILRELVRATLSPYFQNISESGYQALRLLQTIEKHVPQLSEILNGLEKRYGCHPSRSRKGSSK